MSGATLDDDITFNLATVRRRLDAAAHRAPGREGWAPLSGGIKPITNVIGHDGQPVNIDFVNIRRFQTLQLPTHDSGNGAFILAFVGQRSERVPQFVEPRHVITNQLCFHQLRFEKPKPAADSVVMFVPRAAGAVA